jgi:hypothetical protein
MMATSCLDAAIIRNDCANGVLSSLRSFEIEASRGAIARFVQPAVSRRISQRWIQTNIPSNPQTANPTSTS